MSLVSMTGYGRGELLVKGLKVEVELSSVNRKQFDARIGLPGNIAALDAKIKKVIHGSVSRGSVTGVIRIGQASKGAARRSTIDIEAAQHHLSELRKAAKKLKINDDLGLSHLLRMPDVVKSVEGVRETDVSWLSIKKTLDKALAGLVKMRKTEGRELARDIDGRLSVLNGYLDVIKKRVPFAEKSIRSRIKKKLRDADLKVSEKDDRLQKEIIFYIDKSDVSEEIVRLDSHFKHMQKTMKDREPVGRSLDFLCQEMFREINTIGSKSNDAAISRQVVLFKTELECVREQVQNVE